GAFWLVINGFIKAAIHRGWQGVVVPSSNEMLPGCRNATFSIRRPVSGPLPSRRRTSPATVRLRRAHQDSTSSPSPPPMVAAETAFTSANPTGCAGLSIQPDILHTKIVDDAVDHHRPILDLRPPAVRETIVEDDRPGSVLG